MNKLMLSLLSIPVVFSSLISANETELEDVLVTAKVQSETIDTAGSFNIINQDDIKFSNVPSIQGILEKTVGINVSANNRSINGRKNITFRGMNPEHTAILIDGKRVSNTDAQIGHSDFQYNWIPMSAISKIEIVRGPMSSLYGSKALGGVVNIITQKPENTLSGNIDIKYTKAVDQGGEGKDISLNLSGKVNDKFSIAFYAEKKLLDPIDNEDGKDNPASKDRYNNYNESQAEGKDIKNAMLNLWYTIDDTQEISATVLKGKEIRDAITIDLAGTRQTSIDVTGIKAQQGIITAQNARKQKANVQINNYFKKAYDIDKEHYSLQYNKSFESSDMSLQAYTTKSDVHSGVFEYTHKLKDTVVAADLKVYSYDDHYIVAGIDYRKEYYDKVYDSPTFTLDFTQIRNAVPPSMRNAPFLQDKTIENTDFSEDISQSSFYFQDEITASDELLVTLGARVDKHENFDTIASPKIFGVYRLGTNSRLKAGYGKGFNAPTLTQSSDDYEFSNPSAGHAFRGNSDLDPETTNTYEIGYEFTNKIQSFKATAFYNDIKNLISNKPYLNADGTRKMTGDGTPLDIYANISSATAKGIELEYSKSNLIKNVDLNTSYTYLKTKDKEKDRVLNFRPEHKINASLKYKITDTLISVLSVAYTGKQKNYFDEQYSAISNDEGIMYTDEKGDIPVKHKVSTLDGYTTVKFQISKDFTKNLSARFGIDNLTNTQLDDAYNFQLRERTYYAGMTYRF
ncbi:MAG: hypothetical protein CSA86_01015 [Arcobacter sp.]|nr:MAG: hypothetical protein CSA86_01015 [Arcobacter sp.]